MTATPLEGLRYLAADTPLYPAHHHAATLIELALDRGIKEDRLLRHTKLFRDDICKPTALLTPTSFRQLVENIIKHGQGTELSLLWGSQLFPGHYGTVSTLLEHAANLREFLETLIHFQHHLSPLLIPRMIEDSRWCYLYWIDSNGAGAARQFMAAALMAGVRSASNWLAGETLPWHSITCRR